MQTSLPIVERSYEIYKSIIDMNSKLDKRWRHSLGISTEETCLSLLEQLSMAKHTQKPLKASYLIKASAHLDILRLKLRLLLELNLVNTTKIFQIQGKIDETGRMLGGWLKALKSS